MFRAPAWCSCCYRNHTVGTQPISSFSNAINLQLNADAFCEKSFIMGIFWRSYANLFWRSVFLNTVYIIENLKFLTQTQQLHKWQTVGLQLMLKVSFSFSTAWSKTAWSPVWWAIFWSDLCYCSTRRALRWLTSLMSVRCTHDVYRIQFRAIGQPQMWRQILYIPLKFTEKVLDINLH